MSCENISQPSQEETKDRPSTDHLPPTTLSSTSSSSGYELRQRRPVNYSNSGIHLVFPSSPSTISKASKSSAKHQAESAAMVPHKLSTSSKNISPSDKLLIDTSSDE